MAVRRPLDLSRSALRTRRSTTLPFAPLLVLVALASACESAAPLPGDEARVSITLTTAERAEVQATFDDAACVCEAVTLLSQGELDLQVASGTPTFTPINVRRKLLPTSTSDASLAAYAASHLSSAPVRRLFCASASLSSFSARGALPPRALGDNATSACVAEWNASTLPVASRINPIGPLCAAEFDYCLANELRLEASSLVNGPSSAAVRVELERLALGRAATAIQGYGVQLSECNENAAAPGCSALLQAGAATPLARAVGSRFADAVDGVAELAALRHGDVLALSDAIPPPGETPSTFVSAVWNGPTGRGASLAPLYGSGGPPISETISAHDDLSVVRMLRLVDLYDAPMPFARVQEVLFDPTTGLITRRFVFRPERLLPTPGAARDAKVNALFNLLDLRIAVARTGTRTPAFANGVTVDAGLVARVANGESILTTELPFFTTARLRSSPLREVFRLEPQHMAAAMDLAFDVLSTMRVDFGAREMLYPPFVVDGVNGFYAVDLGPIGQRDARDVLWRRQELDLGAAPIPNAAVRVRSAATNTWYRAALDADDVGAGNVLHRARVVARWLAAPAGRPLGNVVDSARVASTVDALVGTSFTEFSRDRLTGSGITPRAQPLWALYSPNAVTPPGATYYLVYGPDADCLRYGPTGGLGTCAPLAAANRLVGCVTSSWLGTHVRTSCALPRDPSTSAGTYYIARTVPDGAGGQTFTVIDRVPTTRNAVHTLGGEWEETAGRALARSATAPAFPALNSLNLPRGFVPPLENSLTSGGLAGEDSWRAYLDAAVAQSTSAESALANARAAELRALLNAVSDDARVAASATEARYEISDLCGEAASCVSARTTARPIALPFRDLVDGSTTVVIDAVVDSPSLPPSICTPILTDYLAIADATSGDPESAPDQLAARINCLRQLVDDRLGEAALQGFPTPVVDQLRESTSGDFSRESGQKRALFIRMFDSLATIHRQQRAFNASMSAALTRIDILRTNIGALSDVWPQASCYMRVAAGAIKLCAGISSGINAVGFGGSVSETTADISKASTASLADFANIGQCDTGDAQLTLVLGASAGVAESLASAYMVLDELLAARADVDLAINELDSLEARASAATARASNAGALIATDAVEDLEEWKIHQGFEQSRARDALRRAQVSAFVARRAIEFRTVTNLSTRTVAEPFVEAPSTWADGLTAIQFANVAGVSTASEGIADYVSRLDSFINGYPFGERFAEGQDTATVNVRSYLFETGLQLPPPVGETESLPAPVWKFLRYTCGDGTAELNASILPEGVAPCAAHGLVTYAEVALLADEGAASPLGRRLRPGGYNFRIVNVGMNLVGSRVIDCEGLPPALRVACRGDGNVQYALSQSTVVRATDWDGREVAFDAGPGRIEGARALAAERYLTTPLSSADRALLTPYLRSELTGRPLFSELRLRIYNRPGLDWTHLDDVQLLIDYTRWEQQR